MLKIFYTYEKITSNDFTSRILIEHYHLIAPEFIQNRYGKPYLADNALYFNLSHSANMTILAVSDKEVGIDCEKNKPRKTDAILRNLTETERGEIFELHDFYRHWTIKESYVKFVGTSIAKELSHLRYEEGKLYHDNELQDLSLTTFDLDEFVISCCQLRNEPYELIRV